MAKYSGRKATNRASLQVFRNNGSAVAPYINHTTNARVEGIGKLQRQSVTLGYNPPIKSKHDIHSI